MNEVFLCAKHGLPWVKGCADCDADLDALAEMSEEDEVYYTLTDLGEAYRRAMGAKLNGAVKAGEKE